MPQVSSRGRQAPRSGRRLRLVERRPSVSPPGMRHSNKQCQLLTQTIFLPTSQTDHQPHHRAALALHSQRTASDTSSCFISTHPTSVEDRARSRTDRHVVTTGFPSQWPGFRDSLVDPLGTVALARPSSSRDLTAPHLLFDGTPIARRIRARARLLLAARRR